MLYERFLIHEQFTKFYMFDNKCILKRWTFYYSDGTDEILTKMVRIK